MIIIPAISKRANTRGYADSGDQQIVYVDVLDPALVHGLPLQWRELAGGEALLAAEVRFGAGEADLRRYAAAARRTMPMPWIVSPVRAWVAEGQRPHMLARGKTSGYTMHNAVLSAMTAARLMSAPAVIAAELYTQGMLAGARLVGRGDANAARELLRHAPIGAQARWDVSLGEALSLWLRELVNRRILTLRAEALDLTLDGVEDLRSIALMEWAHRIAQHWFPGAESLAMPAALAGTPAEGQVDLALNWEPGAMVPLRAVRVLHVGAQAGRREPQPAQPVSPVLVAVTPGSTWASFDFVRVQLGDGTNTGDVTLTSDAPWARWTPPQPLSGPLTATAHGAARGFGVQIQLPPSVRGEHVAIRLNRLVERAILIRAERALLQQRGPITVEIDHPALAASLTPREAKFVLRADAGDLRLVSVGYRALLWQRAAAAPFTVTARLRDGRTATWHDSAAQDSIVVAADMFG